jgi:hypothetical protein
VRERAGGTETFANPLGESRLPKDFVTWLN